MLYPNKNIWVAISLSFLIACTSPEYKQALADYELAKSTKDLKKLSLALKTLAYIAPDEFQNESIKVKEAHSHLQIAEAQLKLGNSYAAYIASHDSYRSVSNPAAKKILISSGKTLLPILKAQLNIDKSFQFLPKHLTPLLSRYSELPLAQWDIIEVNTAVEQLSEAIIVLNRALILIENEEPARKIPELSLWQNSIENQLYITAQARNYFSNFSRYHGAKRLIGLNEQLTADSIKLLSLVRPQLAKESMKPSFKKAQNQYADFQDIIANISLAENTNTKDIHAVWYENWQSIEADILEPKGNFANYPVKSSTRQRQLTAFMNKEKIKIPMLSKTFYDKAKLNQKYHQLTKLINALKEDKALLL